MSNNLIQKEDWAKFSMLCFSFLNSVHNDFNYKINKALDKNLDDPLEYRKLATPMIAMFIAFGVSEKDIIEEKIKLAMKPITRQTSLNYLKSKGYSQVRMLKIIVENWDTCPQMLKDLLRQTNSNFIFPKDKLIIEPAKPVEPIQPIYPNFEPQPNPMSNNLSPVKPNVINFTLRDRAIAKYVNDYLIEIMGYNTYDSIIKLFKERGATDFIFNNKYDLIMGEDFKNLRRNIQDYGKSNFNDIPDLEHSERIYFNKFKLILERFVVVFPYAPDVVHNLRRDEINSITSPGQKTNLPTQGIQFATVPTPQPNFTVKEPVQTISTEPSFQPIPTVLVPVNSAEIPKSNIPIQNVSQQTAQMIELLVSGMENSQVRMAFALLQDTQALQEFADAISRKFINLQAK